VKPSATLIGNGLLGAYGLRELAGALSAGPPATLATVMGSPDAQRGDKLSLHFIDLNVARVGVAFDDC